jgi:hypothetical protein
MKTLFEESELIDLRRHRGEVAELPPQHVTTDDEVLLLRPGGNPIPTHPDTPDLKNEAAVYRFFVWNIYAGSVDAAA